ncbi:MAG: serine protease [Thermobacillus sp. ZCTH02-B1]|uniref:S1C family serine protease n=1 Tax=Thermobacillus sp. ZCTH02-B1 TaxID=1858795 RepID=UPI000B5812CD|nr:trypsin-like peptidase domain-containing protein [Thermobacillus sp. ZCTH02-B1]OUM93685.1 MAG: serine protease [Thermobacillus sp. ZCTH02-B1]
MSLFDDDFDFYSTRVSRRTRDGARRDWHFGGRSGWRRWRGDGGGGFRQIYLAFISSSVSALVAVLLFGLIFGFGGRGGEGSATAVSGPVMMTVDTAERIVQASHIGKMSAVSIINEQLLPKGGRWFRQGDGRDPEAELTLQQASLGSGVIFRKEKGKAYIITNHHVIENADQVKAVLSNGEAREARIVGKDQISDLAVLEIDGSGVETVAAIGDSRKIRDGDIVIAIGNPLGLSDSLTMGIVSKNVRVIPVSLGQNGVYDWEQEVIQISAQINQGNSGGALVNLNGEVVGINSMKVADYGVEGVGFAIPMHNVMPVVEQLLKLGYVPRPYLGVYTMDLEQYWEQQLYEEWLREDEADEEDGGNEDDLKLPDDVERGVVVLEAVGPAKKAGLMSNDVIVKLDDTPIGSTMELRKYLYGQKKIGEKVKVYFYRDGKLETVELVLADRIEEEDE